MTGDMAQQFIELAKLTPKTNLVVFAGRVGGQLMDNAKYIFNYCARTRQPFKSVFLTHDPEVKATMEQAKLPVVLFPSAEAVKILAKARLVVCDDFWWRTDSQSFLLMHNVPVVQIWHGIPLKLIGFPEIESAVGMDEEKANRLRFGYSGYDAVISTSPFVTETAFSKVFKTRTIWETGYPRNDVLLRDPDADDMLGVDLNVYRAIVKRRKAGAKIVTYMPTFRDSGGGPVEDRAVDIGALNVFGEKHNIIFLLKLHPYISLEIDLGLSNVMVVKAESDAYPILRHTDCLLTDYSSVAYDFLLTGRPIIFYPYDLEKYLKKDREMFYDFKDMAPGPHPATQDELFATFLKVLVHGQDDHVEERAKLTDKLYTHTDDKASERIVEHIKAEYFTKK
ncbi:CDP-glycerol glycerophosphotransferase family protein [Pseudodesulfovibrio sp. zrk46]|uniref:CDP-glycerol glycerophosphotransferase family protein n=1 Tax=Pseudodesulfovibrio sp. zrk46 TaxID=2725288 RepID=UPI001448B9D0|nr:CDP-glycerol glycerophosphotransferase family protein [Pseudodesulfovibrio sp. zrk46]QJB55719.1 CDP-glycerol--poly(glycerophosphate) glycerophosphotransferase [Pseudodesulfovibrio sp. zrk46]